MAMAATSLRHPPATGSFKSLRNHISDSLVLAELEPELPRKQALDKQMVDVFQNLLAQCALVEMIQPTPLPSGQCTATVSQSL
jgi:hypothetical protein